MTLNDVARIAEVSKSTVSRTFSRPASVHPRTRQKVLDVAQNIGYVPFGRPPAESDSSTRSIGLFVPDIANPFFPPVIKAIQARARQHGYSVLLSDSDEQTEDEAQIVRAMIGRVDGLILVAPRMSERDLLDIASQTEVVVVNRSVAALAHCVTAADDGLAQAVEHLAALGHREVVYLAGPRGSFSNSVRLEALQRAADELGIALRELGPFEPRFEEGERATDLVLALGSSAVIAYNDLVALGLMTQLGRRGITVGKDISVIGIDDIWLAQLTTPALTSVHVPMAESGTVAVQTLLDALESESTQTPRGARLATRLVVRASTGPFVPQTATR